LSSGVLNASTLVIRDSIGPNSSLTDGWPGVLAQHDVGTWYTPGLVVNVPEDGELTQARFVIFASKTVNQPENNLANIYGYPMEFHVWTDGIEGGADSFDENPHGGVAPGHIDIDVNTPTTSHITVVPFGHTGPGVDPNRFTTFLVTMDLSSFNIALQAGTEYAMGIIQDSEVNFITGGGFFRVIASRATGFEDVFRAFNTDPALRPGYVDSQYNFGYEQFGGSFTLTTFGPGDYDFDGDVDTIDYNKWRSEFGTTSFKSDGNDDGQVDAADYVVWRKHLPPPASGSTSSTAVPEPSTFFLIVVGAISLLCIRRFTHR
jgi:PEP-CTERM motif